jgi:hypothetical protein
MDQYVTHDRQEETPEAKAVWFQSLELVERMEILCAYYELFLSANPNILRLKDAQPVKGRVLVLSET